MSIASNVMFSDIHGNQVNHYKVKEMMEVFDSIPPVVFMFTLILDHEFLV